MQLQGLVALAGGEGTTLADACQQGILQEPCTTGQGMHVLS